MKCRQIWIAITIEAGPALPIYEQIQQRLGLAFGYTRNRNLAMATNVAILQFCWYDVDEDALLVAVLRSAWIPRNSQSRRDHFGVLQIWLNSIRADFNPTLTHNTDSSPFQSVP